MPSLVHFHKPDSFVDYQTIFMRNFDSFPKLNAWLALVYIVIIGSSSLSVWLQNGGALRQIWGVVWYDAVCWWVIRCDVMWCVAVSLTWCGALCLDATRCGAVCWRATWHGVVWLVGNLYYLLPIQQDVDWILPVVSVVQTTEDDLSCGNDHQIPNYSYLQQELELTTTNKQIDTLITSSVLWMLKKLLNMSTHSLVSVYLKIHSFFLLKGVFFNQRRWGLITF